MKQERGPQIPRWQKVPLAMLAMRLKRQARDRKSALEESVRLFKPATVIGWHQAMVRRKWTYKQGSKPGRPPIDKEMEQLIVQVARDNPDLGYEKLAGEMNKLGYDVSKTTVSTVLTRHGILPAPEQGRQGSNWQTFLNHYQDQFLACDFFTSRHCGCRRCMYFSSLSMAQGEYILQDVRHTRLGNGWSSRLGRYRGNYKNAKPQYAI